MLLLLEITFVIIFHYMITPVDSDNVLDNLDTQSHAKNIATKTDSPLSFHLRNCMYQASDLFLQKQRIAKPLTIHGPGCASNEPPTAGYLACIYPQWLLWSSAWASILPYAGNNCVPGIHWLSVRTTDCTSHRPDDFSLMFVSMSSFQLQRTASSRSSHVNTLHIFKPQLCLYGK